MAAQETNGLKKMLWQAAGTLIVTIVLQSGVLAYWAGAISTRMSVAERDIGQICERIHAIERRLPPAN